MNGPTIAVLGILAVVVVLAAIRIKKKGGCSCGSSKSCSSCSCSSKKECK